MKTKLRALIAGAAALALLSGCAAGPSTEASDELTLVRWVQPGPASMGFYPAVIGDALGYFEEEGIQIEILPASDDIPIPAMIANDNADIGIASASEIMHAVQSGADFRILYEEYRASVEGLVVPDDSKIQDIGDLEGGTVGLASDEERAFVATALAAGGLSEDDVAFAVVGTSGPTLANEVEKGTIDAFSGSVEDFAALDSLGIPTRDITPPEIRETPSGAIFVTPEWLDENPELAEGFLRAFAKATHAGLADRDATAAILREQVPEDWQNEEVSDPLYDIIRELHTPPSGARIGEIVPERWQSAMDRYLAIGELVEEVDLSTLLVLDFLDSISDWDESAVEHDLSDQ